MSKTRVARVISTIGHPFTFIVLLVLLPFWLHGEAGVLRVIGIVVGAGLLPLGLFMWQRYASGKWRTIDASARRDRSTLYLAVFAVLVPFGLYFLFVEKSSILARGCGVMVLMLGVAAALSRWIKLSLHLAFAGFSGLVLARIRLAYALPIGLFIPVLAWSRLTLLRHSVPEVLGGSHLAWSRLALCYGCDPKNAQQTLHQNRRPPLRYWLRSEIRTLDSLPMPG